MEAIIEPHAQPSPEPFLNAKQALAALGQRLGRRVYHANLHQWIAEQGLPARRNPLKRSPQGSPTFLFLKSELDEWLDTKIQRVK